MKARHIIGFLMATLGLFVAVCTVDGSDYELAVRVGGCALLAIGVAVGGWYDTKEGGAQ